MYNGPGPVEVSMVVRVRHFSKLETRTSSLCRDELAILLVLLALGGGRVCNGLSSSDSRATLTLFGFPDVAPYHVLSEHKETIAITGIDRLILREQDDIVTSGF